MLGKRQDFDAGVIKPDVAFLNMVEGKLIVTDPELLFTATFLRVGNDLYLQG